MSAASQFFGGGNGGVEGIPLRVLVVAGGGGSGAYSVNLGANANLSTSPTYAGISGSGGGGAIHEIKGYPGKKGRTYNITVGAGGTAGEALGDYSSDPAGVGIGQTAYAGGNGENSVFTDPAGYTFTAEGGGGGGAAAYHSGPESAPNYPTAFQNNPLIVYGKDGGCGGSGATDDNPLAQAGSVAKRWQGGAGNAFSSLHFWHGPGGTPVAPTGKDELIQTEYGVNGGFPSVQTAATTGNPAQNYSGGAGRREVNRLIAQYGMAPDSNYGPGPETAGASYPQVHGGNGYLSNIEGSMKAYGAGRESLKYLQNPNVPDPDRSPQYPTALPIANTGYGAYGVCAHPNLINNNIYHRWEGPGFAGSSGVVIIQYPSSFGNSTTTGTVTDLSSNTPGYKTYKFTTDGTIQLP